MEFSRGPIWNGEGAKNAPYFSQKLQMLERSNLAQMLNNLNTLKKYGYQTHSHVIILMTSSYILLSLLLLILLLLFILLLLLLLLLQK